MPPAGSRRGRVRSGKLKMVEALPLRAMAFNHEISAAIMAGTIVASTASFAVPRYDGLWSVSIVTEKGDCDRGYRYPVRISNGTLANAGDTMFTITGKVAGTGAVTVTVNAAGRSATGSGRLAGNIGMGSWSGGA